jgi:hypothetical protein
MCCNRPSFPTAPQSQRAGWPASGRPQPVAKAAPAHTPLALPTAVFEYVGATALTLVSPVTRKSYRFEHPGARVAVDVRDRSWVAFVPNLKLVR